MKINTQISTLGLLTILCGCSTQTAQLPKDIDKFTITRKIIVEPISLSKALTETKRTKETFFAQDNGRKSVIQVYDVGPAVNGAHVTGDRKTYRIVETSTYKLIESKKEQVASSKKSHSEPARPVKVDEAQKTAKELREANVATAEAGGTPADSKVPVFVQPDFQVDPSERVDPDKRDAGTVNKDSAADTMRLENSGAHK